MTTKPIINEQVLEGIPDHLIRPLLAISIRASHPHTIASYRQLLKDIQKVGLACLEGESLYYIRVENMVRQRLQALEAAQKWVDAPDAEAADIDVNRWSVGVNTSGSYRKVLVAYERAGTDHRRREERVRFRITEATEQDV